MEHELVDWNAKIGDFISLPDKYGEHRKNLEVIATDEESLTHVNPYGDVQPYRVSYGHLKDIGAYYESRSE